MSEVTVGMVDNAGGHPVQCEHIRCKPHAAQFYVLTAQQHQVFACHDHLPSFVTIIAELGDLRASRC